MSLEKPYQRREQGGVGRAAPQLVCPDSGQVQEPQRAPFVR